jgi:hypothetical protein
MVDNYWFVVFGEFVANLSASKKLLPAKQNNDWESDAIPLVCKKTDCSASYDPS